LDKSTPHGVLVKIVDHRPQRSRIADVAIIAAASLPKAVVNFAVGLLISEPIEKWGRLISQKSQGFPLHRDLHAGADQANLIVEVARINKDMDVFRHDDVSPQGKVEALPSGVQGFDEPLTGSVSVKKGKAMETGESEFMGMARFIERSILFSARLGHGRMSRLRRAGMLSRLDTS
jgi:hypothetical protein